MCIALHIPLPSAEARRQKMFPKFESKMFLKTDSTGVFWRLYTRTSVQNLKGDAPSKRTPSRSSRHSWHPHLPFSTSLPRFPPWPWGLPFLPWGVPCFRRICNGVYSKVTSLTAASQLPPGASSLQQLTIAPLEGFLFLLGSLVVPPLLPPPCTRKEDLRTDQGRSRVASVKVRFVSAVSTPTEGWNNHGPPSRGSRRLWRLP